jgi:hypothetical protein
MSRAQFMVFLLLLYDFHLPEISHSTIARQDLVGQSFVRLRRLWPSLKKPPRSSLCFSAVLTSSAI